MTAEDSTDKRTPSKKLINTDLGGQRLAKTQALKLLREIFPLPDCISFSAHCREELKNDDLTTVDALNTLRAGKIYSEGEEKNGTWRYRVETQKIIVVIAFKNPHHIRCVTAWRK